MNPISSDSKRPFLATTALDPFWDRKSRIIFLGEWCLPCNRGEALKNLDYAFCRYPWDDRKRLMEAAKYCRSFYERTLAEIARFLNKTNGLNHSSRYWEIVLGSWLIRYIEALYDRYICVREAQDSFGSLRTIGLDPASFVTPLDYSHFESLYIDDPYNLQLFTHICEHEGVLIEDYRPLKTAAKFLSGANPSKSICRNLLKKSRCFINQTTFALLSRFVPIWLVSVYGARKDQLSLSLRMRGASFPFDFRFLEEEIEPLERQAVKNVSLRKALTEHLLAQGGKDKFESLFAKTLEHNFPLMYLEGYPLVIQKLKSFFEIKPQALVSSTGLHANKAYPFLAAQLAEEGKEIITIQHGGSFGTVALSSMEYQDQAVSDEYWSWGWRDGLAGLCRPVPSLLLFNTRKFKDSILRKAKAFLDRRSHTRVLYCGNTVPRYLYLMWSNPIGPQWNQVIQWRHRWLNRLLPDIWNRLLIRLDPTEYGWLDRKGLMETFPSIAIDDYQQPLKKSFEWCDIIVVDSNHTVLLEALTMNKPTVAFWDPEFNELRPSAKPFYNSLKEAGILCHDPEEAAERVNEIYSNPYYWWSQEKLQNARLQFCEQFAYVSDKWREVWSRELFRLLTKAKKTPFPLNAKSHYRYLDSSFSETQKREKISSGTLVE